MPYLRTIFLFCMVIAIDAWGCETSKTDRQQSSEAQESSKTSPKEASRADKNSHVGTGPFVYDHSIGARGDKPGQFEQPVGLAVGARGMLYVSDAGNRRMQKLDPDGDSLAVWAEGIERPMHLGWSKDDRLITAVFVKGRVELFDDTEIVSGFGGEWLDAPAGAVQAKDGRFYVADFYHHQFHIVSADGDLLKSIGQKGEKDGQFTYPTDVAIGAEGRIWIADAYAHRLQVFSPDGQHQKTLGGWGKEPGKFRVATGIDIGPRGRVYVADFNNNRVQVLDDAGTPLAVLGVGSEGGESMKMPTEVVATGERVYVVDHGHHQIDVWGMRDN